MFDDFSTFLLLTPLWLTAVVLLALGSRWRGLARPLWNAERVGGTVVAHERWVFANGAERVGIVVDFVDQRGVTGRLIEPPVRWARPPEVGATVRVSHRGGDLTFAKRCERRRQALAWLATLGAMPVVTMMLRLFPLPMSLVLGPHVLWLAFRRWRPGPAPTREPAVQHLMGTAGFDPDSIPVPTSPPLLQDGVVTPPTTCEDTTLTGEGDETPIAELVHRHAFALVSAGVVVVVALIGASRSSVDFSLGLHLGLVVMLMTGIVTFETSLAYRRGSVVAGRVVGHQHRRETEGDVYWLEVIEFVTPRGTESFVDTIGPRRLRPVGSTATVSFRPGEQRRPRSLQRSQSLLGTALIAGAVGLGIFISAPTWIPVLLQAAVCYAGYIVLDVVRGSAGARVELQPS